MEQDMRVVKQITEEDSDESKPTKYKVRLAHISIAKNPKPATNTRVIKNLVIESEHASLFTDFPHNELVAVRISKPQAKL